MTENWMETLHGALDLVDYGVVLLDDRLSVRLINPAFRRMWALPQSAPAGSYTLEALVQLERDSLQPELAPEQIQNYVAERIAHVTAGADGPTTLRLLDGRIIRYQCVSLPGGGRMLCHADQTDAVKTIEQLDALSNIDELTHIHNRRFLYSHGHNEVTRARRYGRPISVIMLDIDHFKQFNDLHGNPAGDALLAAVARCCRESIRASDLVGRLGGAELALILPETRIAAAISVAEKLRKKISESELQYGAVELRATASIGVATLTDDDKDFEDLLRVANDALDIARRNGRDRVVAETR